MNHRNPAIKRILADVKELQRHPSSRYHATPLEDNMFEWHFTIRGPDDTAFAGGIYHGRILLPAEYPFKPPNIVFLTKNGRFEVGTKICLSISAYHEETWQPAWGVRTMLEAIISFLPSEGAGAIGALDWSAEERKRLARLSHSFVCPTCGPIAQLLSEPSKEEEEKPDSTIQEQVAQLHFGPPTRSDSVKHTLTTAATDLLLANALGSPVAPPVSTAALSPDLAGNITVDDDNVTTTTLELDQNPESVILADSHDTAVSEMVMEETTIELSEDAVDNFETLQDIEEVRRRFQHHPSKRGVKEENEKSETDKSFIESKETVTHPRPNPLTQHNPPVPPAPAAAIPPLPRQAPPRLAPQNNHNVVEQLRRIEEFLNTIILITVVGILAILIRVFIRNILNVDL